MKLVRLLTFKGVGGGGVDERIPNGVYPFSGFHCHTIPICICRSTLVSVTWCKSDEPVRVGCKVLCNYEGRGHFKGILEPVGIVIGLSWFKVYWENGTSNSYEEGDLLWYDYVDDWKDVVRSWGGSVDE